MTHTAPVHLVARPTRAFAILAAAGALALLVVAVPVAGRGGAGLTNAAPDPGASEKPKPSKGPKAEKEPTTPVTLTGTVGTRTDEGGETVYTLTVGSTVHDLEAGPPWFWGDANPLKPLVGKTVTIEGEQAAGSTTVEVATADGTAIRGEGKPPWAGGWKVVGKAHPGWAQWKVDKQAAKGAAGKAGAGHGRPSWAGPKSPEPSPDN
jgi:hypothetical protein